MFLEKDIAILSKIKDLYKDNLQNIRLAKIKNDNLLLLVKENKETYQAINAYVLLNNELKHAGFCNYKIGKGIFFDIETIISTIKTFNEFQNLSIATYIERFLSEITTARRVNNISGKFYPDNEFAENFYNSKGYEIVKDGYETFILKNITEKEIQTNNFHTFELDGLKFYEPISKTQKAELVQDL